MAGLCRQFLAFKLVAFLDYTEAYFGFSLQAGYPDYLGSDY